MAHKTRGRTLRKAQRVVAGGCPGDGIPVVVGGARKTTVDKQHAAAVGHFERQTTRLRFRCHLNGRRRADIGDDQCRSPLKPGVP